MLKEIKLYNNTVTIRFDDENHKYWDEKGERLKSVTKITGVVDKSAALMGWAIKKMGLFLEKNWKPNKIYTKNERDELIALAKKEYRWFQKKAQDIGTEIHEWISDWILGKNPVMPENKKVLNGVKAFLRFQKKYNFEWLASERVVYSRKYGYCGTLDGIAKGAIRQEKETTIAGVNVKVKVLVDFKSTNEKIDKATGEVIEVPIYPESALQTSGYQVAYEEETKEKISYRIVIAFGKLTGEFNFKVFDENMKDRKAFLACRTTEKRLEELKK